MKLIETHRGVVRTDRGQTSVSLTTRTAALSTRFSLSATLHRVHCSSRRVMSRKRACTSVAGSIKSFYRAMLHRARLWDCISSVCR